MNTVKDKVAYITGGSKGIGFGIAHTLIEAGMKVAISGRDKESIEQAKHALGNQNVLAIVSVVEIMKTK
ncbi:Bile acid 7-dehydroxylase 1/3 [Weeksella virosa]|nr:Bile acid 7-dehydroxylase 1/3 [Weeksella virosa]